MAFSIRRTPADERDTARPAARHGGAPSTVGAVGRFMLASLVAVVGFGAILLLVQRRAGTREAERNSREVAVLIGRAIIGPLLTDDVIAGDPTALAALDRVVRERVLDERVVRIKVWGADGRVIYSDRPELIGTRLRGGAGAGGRAEGETAAAAGARTGQPVEYEHGIAGLLEVNYPIVAPGGQRVDVESYERVAPVSAGAGRMWLAIAPMLAGVMLLLWLAQGPLAMSMARRLQRGVRERERLLASAVEASHAERCRIAADLHDGVVQRLAGTAYTLAAARAAMPDASGEAREDLQDAIVGVRESMRELRSLIVEIHPPTLAAQGLAAALEGLVAPLSARSIDVRVDVPDGLPTTPEVDRLIFRGAQEALRNVVTHANARTVTVSLSACDGRTRLTVEDDGCGLHDGELETSRRSGHVGLSLLGELARGMGGRLQVGPGSRGGTRLLLEVPSA